MTGSWVRITGALLVLSLVAGCGASHDIGDVEERLARHYLEPLAAAGIDAAVLETCRYRGSVDEPWHLSIELRLDATQGRAADVLQGEGMVVLRDRDPMIVQQIPDNPSDGWNGVLAGKGDGSLLTLVYNNVRHSGWSGAVGWAESCPSGVGSDG